MKSLRGKILGGFSVILILFIVLLLYCFSKISTFDQNVKEIVTEEIPLLIYDEVLSKDIQKQIALLRGYVLFGEEDYKNRFFEIKEESEISQAKLLSISTSKEAEELVDKTKQWNEIVVSDLFPAYESGNEELTTEILKGDVTSLGREIDEGFNELALQRQNEIQVFGEELVGMGKNLIKSMIIISIFAILASILVSFILANQIINPILVVVKRMKRIAEGDLSGEKIQTKSKDEIGQLTKSTNEMLENLQQIIKEVRQSSVQVASSAEELTASAEETSKVTEHITTAVLEIALGTSNELKSAEDTLQIIHEVSDGAQQIAQHSESVVTTAVNTSEKAALGTQSIKTATEQMNSINKSVNGLAKVIKELGDRSNEINQINDVISTIANQTNLLALNAAIEAVRAGEHGRGFAVVAEEVKKLAEQSVQSAKQISQIILLIQEESDKAFQSMEVATKEVQTGLSMINESGQSFTMIEDSIHIVTTQIQEVAAASQQMAAGTEQVVHSMRQITEVTGTIASSTDEVSTATEEQLASMEEITAASNSLTNMAENLQSLTGKFKL